VQKRRYGGGRGLRLLVSMRMLCGSAGVGVGVGVGACLASMCACVRVPFCVSISMSVLCFLQSYMCGVCMLRAQLFA